MRLPVVIALLVGSQAAHLACGSGSGSTGAGGMGGSSVAGTSGTAGGSGGGGVGTGGGGTVGTGGGGTVGTGGGGTVGTGGGGTVGTGGGGTVGTGGGGTVGSGGTGTARGGTVGTGGTGTGGSAGGSGFPTQACLDRANALLAQMTLDEKAAQTIQAERAQITPAQVTQFSVGSVYSQGGSAPAQNDPMGWATMINGYRAASRASRLKVPIIYGLDSVHGLGPVSNATVFPHNIGMGATNDLALVEEVARITADESAGVGADFPFAPVIAVARDERWGRTYEAFAETPDLASAMGLAMIKGLQFPTGGSKISILANAKHYVGDGGTANGVTGGPVTGNEAALRALHLEPYRVAVAAKVGSVMLSYNTWQGVEMHINKAMITDVLKGELRFGGFVGTDYNGCAQVGLSSEAGLAACLNAGADMFMIFGNTQVPMPVAASGASILASIRTVVSNGTVPMARLDDAVRRIVAVKCEMGLLDTTGVIDQAATGRVGSAEHRMVARRAVRQSLVVLKNTGNVLPLSKTATVALAGNSAENTGNQCGGWTITWQGVSGNVINGATSVRAAMAAEVGTARVVYSTNGSTTTGAAVGVAVIGETPYSEGMGDKTDLTIPAAQVAVVQALKAAGLPTVVVLIAGRPMILEPLMQYADAIVMAWLPGSEGAGITDILYRNVAPTGKLPMTWPRTMPQIPINQGDATYDPLYPYGHGLTY
jgi:beta-glucosidase